MRLQEIMQAQIDSVMSGLMRIRKNLPMAGTRDEREMIECELERVASHLEDIQHNWLALHATAAPPKQARHLHGGAGRGGNFPALS